MEGIACTLQSVNYCFDFINFEDLLEKILFINNNIFIFKFNSFYVR